MPLSASKFVASLHTLNDQEPLLFLATARFYQPTSLALGDGTDQSDQPRRCRQALRSALAVNGSGVGHFLRLDQNLLHVMGHMSTK